MMVEPAIRESLSLREHGAVPDDARLLRLEVTQLRAYDRNPRRCQNNEYDRIKASIRAQGLDQPLVVTCRPGERDYMLLSGGNTRLQAITDLYQETCDEAFRYLDCFFKPWVTESDVLLSHLRENELRDDLCFIDKARAVLETKALLEAEMQGRPLSQRRLSEMLAARGLNYSQTLISRMVYAVQTLWPLIPQTLLAGMGTPRVARIQGLERTARTLWRNKSLGAEEEFDEIFATLCRRHDSPDWDTDVLQAALETEIAEASEVDLSTIRLELDAKPKGKSSSVNATEFLADGSRHVMPEETTASSSGTERIDVDNQVNSTRDLKQVRVPEATALEGGNCPEVEGQSELGQLRERAYQLASQLAHAHGLGQLVKPLSDEGFGFVVQDVPDQTLTGVLDEQLALMVSAVWWQLVACSEVIAGPSARVAPHLKEGSSFQTAVAAQNPDRLFAAIPPLEPGLLGSHLWPWLTEEDCQTLVALIETYRVLHRISRESGQSLWLA